MTITYTEEFTLSLKQIFILQEIYLSPNREIGFVDFQYLCECATYVNDPAHFATSFYDLEKRGLLENSTGKKNYSYTEIRYKISERGLKIFPQIHNVDTSSLHFLRPTKTN